MFHLLCALCVETFFGNWSQRHAASGVFGTQMSYFLFNITRHTNITYNYQPISVRGIFYNSSHLSFTNMFHYLGLFDPNNETNAYFIRYRPDKDMEIEDCLIKLDERIKKTGLPEMNLSIIHKYFYKFMEEQRPLVNDSDYFCTCLYLEINEGKTSEAFSMNKYIKGFMLYNYTEVFKVAGFNIDLHNYGVHSHVFGVYTAVSILMTFYSWMALKYFSTTVMHYAQLSSVSFSFHVSFDFLYALLLIELPYPMDNTTTSLYSIDSFLLLTIYFACGFMTLVRIWKAQTNQNRDTTELRLSFIKFIGISSFSILVFSLMTTLLYSFPVFSLFFMYSFFIPQIVYSFIHQTKKNNDTVFTILISISRLMPIWYFGLFENNLFGKHDFLLGLLLTLYVELQVIIIILQNIFNGSFCLPKRLRPHGYDYTATRPPEDAICAICLSRFEQDDQTMVTPCGHCFHRECLIQWFDQDLICPVCRTELPMPELD